MSEKSAAAAAAAEVDTRSKDFELMQAGWSLLHDLLGGTRAMRAAGRTWLPQEPKEADAAYANRLARSFLFGAFADAVDRIVAKPFSVPTTVEGGSPAYFAEMLRNVDNCGNDLTLFARSVFEDGVIHGLSHILVDHPDTGGTLTAKQERDLKIRPYFVHVRADQLIGHRSKRDAAGRNVLTQIRIYEKKVEDAGEYGDVSVEYVRVVTETSFSIWRKTADDAKFVKVKSGDHTFGSVPLVTFYTSADGFMKATPPLEDVAWLNLAHWQSYSDQRNILRFARVGLLFGSGFSEEEVERGFSVGPTNLLLVTSPDAKLSIVEHSGNAIGSGKDDLETLEAKMDSLGLRPFVDQKGNPTATGKAMDEEKSFSSILAWIRSLESALRTAFGFAATWTQETIADDFEVEVFSDFGISVQTYEAIQNLITARANREISRETFLFEIRRRGLISDSIDIAAEIARIESEPPPAGATGFGAGTFPTQDNTKSGAASGDGSAG